ncbi:MAG: hypothetical protein WB005_01925, partial [Pseudolabrys sp.]
MRPEELYTSKLNAAVASLRYSGVRLARVCTCAFSQKGVSVARLLLQDVTPGKITAAPKSNSCPAVVLKRMPFCGSLCIVMAVLPVRHQSFHFDKLGIQTFAAPNQVRPT